MPRGYKYGKERTVLHVSSHISVENHVAAVQGSSAIRMSTSRLLEILQNVKNPGSFATGGVAANIHRPVIKIEGIPETIRQSIDEPEAKAIIEKCSRAPYGRGKETIVDTSVRRTWQLDPSQFTVYVAIGYSMDMNASVWKQSLDALVNEVKVDLGFAASHDVSCELYKLLLYEPGGFFKVRTAYE